MIVFVDPAGARVIIFEGEVYTWRPFPVSNVGDWYSESAGVLDSDIGFRGQDLAEAHRDRE